MPLYHNAPYLAATLLTFGYSAAGGTTFASLF